MSGPCRKVNIQQAKTNLSRLLREVEAGEVIEIARAGKVIARLVRAEEAGPRQWGGFEDRVQFEPDAFDPLPDAEAAEWDEGPLE